MELLEYWKIVRKRLLLIIVLALIGPGAAVLYTMRQPPLYRTTTTLFLNPAAANPLLPFQSTKTVQSVANTYMEFMRTRSFATLVSEQSGLTVTTEQILRILDTQYVEDTQFFRITATAGDALSAQIIANTAAEVLISENAARQQAEQAQIQSQLSQNPEVQQLTDLRDALRTALDNHSQRISSLQEQIANLEARPPSERNEDRLTGLREELISEQNGRVSTLTSLAQAQAALVERGGASTGQAPDTAVVVDPAPLPGPMPRNIVERALLALVISMAVGVGIAFALEYLDYTVRTPEALDLVYGQPTLGVIATVASPRTPEQRRNNYKLTVSDPMSPSAESIRALRTSIEVARLVDPIRSLLITSAGPGEGKTFVAANLAVSLAQNGNRVILVDGDLRKPNLHQVFALTREPGFSNLVLDTPDPAAALRPRLKLIYERASNREALRQALVADSGRNRVSAGQLVALLDAVESDDPEVLELVAESRRLLRMGEDVSRYLQPTGIENLRLLTCGSIPQHPAELLGSGRAARVLQLLEESADIVIVDTPPAATVTDAAVLAPRVDAVVQVVRAGVTRIDLVKRCKSVLLQANAKVMGPVLNQVRQADLGYYSYYYTYGYYHQGGRRSRRPALTNGSGSGNGHHHHRREHGVNGKAVNGTAASSVVGELHHAANGQVVDVAPERNGTEG